MDSVQIGVYVRVKLEKGRLVLTSHGQLTDHEITVT